MPPISLSTKPFYNALMAYKEKEIKKLYYSIGEVAKMFNVSTSLIRFWETEFDVLKPRKNKKGNRLFTDKDINNLHTIYHLVKEKGFTLEGARKRLRSRDNSDKNNLEVIKTLKRLRGFLTDIQQQLV